MKTKISTLALLTAFFISGDATYSQKAVAGTAGQNESTSYSVISRSDVSPNPTSFQKTKAPAINGAFSENIVTFTERVFNKDSWMLKKGLVQPVGEKRFSAWQFLCDEGGPTHEQAAPNPLSYMTSGIASSLLTQLQRAAQVMNLNIDDIKVESKVTFQWKDGGTSKWSGYTNKVIANIIIDSKESAEKIADLKTTAFQSWAIGYGLVNKIKVQSDVAVNAPHWDGHGAHDGAVSGPVSVDNGLTLSDKGSALQPLTFELGKDVSMDAIVNSDEFAVVAIAESAHDPERPFMNKIKVRAIQKNYVTWDIYADDSRGYKGIDKAPTSRDYFTLGTSFCLMSQLTANDEMYFKKQGLKVDDYRVAHQFNYSEENFMTPEMTGSMGPIITRGIVKSKEEKKALDNFFYQSLRCCFAGEALTQVTDVQSDLYLKGQIVK
jgi:uncharacterized OsmC-like protein